YSTANELRTGVESGDVALRIGEVAKRVEIDLDGAGLGVDEGQRELHVRGAADVDPEARPALCAGVEYLDQKLEVGRSEEPEEAGVLGLRDRHPLAARPG